MTHKITSQATSSIINFYRNVAKKYKNTYSKELMNKNIDDAINGMYQIEVSLLRRKPISNEWKEKGYFMAKYKMWYYAYIVQDEEVTVVDSEHSQNIKETIVRDTYLRKIIKESMQYKNVIKLTELELRTIVEESVNLIIESNKKDEFRFEWISEIINYLQDIQEKYGDIHVNSNNGDLLTIKFNRKGEKSNLIFF